MAHRFRLYQLGVIGPTPTPHPKKFRLYQLGVIQSAGPLRLRVYQLGVVRDAVVAKLRVYQLGVTSPLPTPPVSRNTGDTAAVIQIWRRTPPTSTRIE